MEISTITSVRKSRVLRRSDPRTRMFMRPWGRGNTTVLVAAIVGGRWVGVGGGMVLLTFATVGELRGEVVLVGVGGIG